MRKAQGKRAEQESMTWMKLRYKFQSSDKTFAFQCFRSSKEITMESKKQSECEKCERFATRSAMGLWPNSLPINFQFIHFSAFQPEVFARNIHGAFFFQVLPSMQLTASSFSSVARFEYQILLVTVRGEKARGSVDDGVKDKKKSVRCLIFNFKSR